MVKKYTLITLLIISSILSFGQTYLPARAQVFISVINGDGDGYAAIGADVEAIHHYDLNTSEQMVDNAIVNSIMTFYQTVPVRAYMVADYPMVGTTATSQQWNFNDPRDLDAAYRIVWSGAPTHDSGGVKFNTLNSGTTFLNPTSLPNGNVGLYYYNRLQQAVGVTAGDMGANTAGVGQLILDCRTAVNTMSARVNALAVVTAANTETRGIYEAKRNGAASYFIAKDNVTLNTGSLATAIPNRNISIGGVQGVVVSTEASWCGYAGVNVGTMNASGSETMFQAIRALNIRLNRYVQ